MSDQPRLNFDSPLIEETPDARARRLAVDPRRNVALEASAGTGKTRVLVDRSSASRPRRAAKHLPSPYRKAAARDAKA